ncbi:MAG: hypothetical protein AB1679_12170 [Actinomycetota bacterium]
MAASLVLEDPDGNPLTGSLFPPVEVDADGKMTVRAPDDRITLLPATVEVYLRNPGDEALFAVEVETNTPLVLSLDRRTWAAHVTLRGTVADPAIPAGGRRRVYWRRPVILDDPMMEALIWARGLEMVRPAS